MEKREAIIRLHHAGESSRNIAKALKSMNVSKSTVSYTIRRYKETLSVKNRTIPGRPRSVRTKALVKATRSKISRNGKRSMRKMASEAGVKRESMRKIVREDLNMSAYKLQKRQLLSSATKDKRLQRSRLLLNFMKAGPQPSIIWTDEKIFTVEAVHNSHNDRILARDINSIPIEERTVFRRQKPASVMVWAGVTSCGRKTPLIFIPEGVKVNQNVYLDMLRSQVKPWVESLEWPSSYVLQQDGAPSHTANRVQAWCKANFDGFWAKEMWPPSSPDLNVMDFSI